MRVYNNQTTFELNESRFETYLRLYQLNNRSIVVLSDISEKGNFNLQQLSLVVPEQVVRKFDLDPHETSWYMHKPRVKSGESVNAFDERDLFEKLDFFEVDEEVLQKDYPARDNEGKLRLLYPIPPAGKSATVKDIESETGEPFSLDMEADERNYGTDLS